MASLWRHIYHALSASNQCCLTPRSTGPATAGGVSLARSGFATVARQAYTACLRGPVSSNVRRHENRTSSFSEWFKSLHCSSHSYASPFACSKSRSSLAHHGANLLLAGGGPGLFRCWAESWRVPQSHSCSLSPQSSFRAQVSPFRACKPLLPACPGLWLGTVHLGASPTQLRRVGARGQSGFQVSCVCSS